jgi:membrane-associated phospholipid phosphatase
MPADISHKSSAPAPAEETVQTANRLGAIMEWVRKLPITRYITIYLVFGFLLSVFSLWTFGEIAEKINEDEVVTAIDLQLASELHASATPTSTAIYVFISWFGSQGVWLLGIVIGLLFIIRRHWLKLLFWVITLVGGALLNDVLKNFFARPRPVFVEPYIIEQHYSFPSAHAMMSLIMYGMIAYLLWREISDRPTRCVIVFDALMLISLIGISRMTLGVHYLSDVLGGFSAGGLWLGACITALNFIQRHGELRQQLRQVAAEATNPTTDSAQSAAYRRL